MNKIFGVLGIVFMATSAQADGSSLITSVGISPITSYLLENCDTNEKTVTEVRECKLKYWRFEVRERQKSLDETQNKLDHARNRVMAFEGDPVAPCLVDRNGIIDKCTK